MGGWGGGAFTAGQHSELQHDGCTAGGWGDGGGALTAGQHSELQQQAAVASELISGVKCEVHCSGKVILRWDGGRGPGMGHRSP